MVFLDPAADCVDFSVAVIGIELGNNPRYQDGALSCPQNIGGQQRVCTAEGVRQESVPAHKQ